MKTSEIAEMELRIENLHTAILALRAAKASPTEIDQVLSELARVKAGRLRRMLHQRNLSSERELHEAAAMSGPQDNGGLP
jgi:hypothetical protein